MAPAYRDGEEFADELFPRDEVERARLSDEDFFRLLDEDAERYYRITALGNDSREWWPFK